MYITASCSKNPGCTTYSFTGTSDVNWETEEFDDGMLAKALTEHYVVSYC